MPIDVPGWEGWFFWEGYICSPNGDRFTPECIMACFFVRQMDAFAHVLYGRPERSEDDVLMEVRNRRIDAVIQAQADLSTLPVLMLPV